MSRSSALILLCATLAAPAFSLTVVPLTREVELDARDRTALQRTACTPLGVDAEAIRGSRYIRWGRLRPLQAWVQCKPHQATTTSRLAFVYQCEKRRDWHCERTWALAQTRFLGIDSFNVNVSDVPVDEALEGLACLEADIARQPGLLGSGKLNDLAYISAHPSRPEMMVTNVSTATRCFGITTARRCPAGAERAPPEMEVGCPEEL
jgi:hypothetical protein